MKSAKSQLLGRYENAHLLCIYRLCNPMIDVQDRLWDWVTLKLLLVVWDAIRGQWMVL